MKPILDPRDRDMEDVASSTHQRSLLSLAGSLFGEISLPKLIVVWILLLVVPALLAGVAPLPVAAWTIAVWPKTANVLTEIWPALLANSVTLSTACCAGAVLVWGIGDALMAQPRDLQDFAAPERGKRTWRVARLSDIHTVGERYGVLIESGRAGPRGNGRLRQTLARLDEIDIRL
jgi:hypothetical protein